MVAAEALPSTSQESDVDAASAFERFRSTEIKIAIQKDGELTSISQTIIANYFGIQVPDRDPSEKKMMAVSEDGRFGYAYARNKDIGRLVASRMIDFAVIGVDRLAEDDIDDQIEVVNSYEDQYSWPLVLAAPEGSGITSAAQVRRVATQYPRTTERFFREQELPGVEIVPTSGSTEMYPYLGTDEAPIDAVVDMCVTGSSMAAHNLVKLPPIVGTAFPVLIRSAQQENA